MPPKIKTFSWKLIRQGIHTRDHIFTSLVIDRSCPFCNDPLETNDHLFLHYSFAKHVWANTYFY